MRDENRNIHTSRIRSSGPPTTSGRRRHRVFVARIRVELIFLSPGWSLLVPTEFFAQSVHIKHDSPQVAQLSVIL